MLGVSLTDISVLRVLCFLPRSSASLPPSLPLSFSRSFSLSFSLSLFLSLSLSRSLSRSRSRSLSLPFPLPVPLSLARSLSLTHSPCMCMCLCLCPRENTFRKYGIHTNSGGGAAVHRRHQSQARAQARLASAHSMLPEHARKPWAYAIRPSCARASVSRVAA